MLINQAEFHSKEAIKQHVVHALSAYGVVESIHILEPAPSNPVLLILATMIDMEQARIASSSLGLRSFGHKSLIIPISQ
ncbi:MAG: hypothetical protein KJ850_01310 [Gammaproteobacteria bacterium]|nr:hypothetical protein [Gammaproteobacteria bacterium]MBU1623659.1 hypothetical protein [Gammaproteobacteria bacterium]